MMSTISKRKKSISILLVIFSGLFFLIFIVPSFGLPNKMLDEGTCIGYKQRYEIPTAVGIRKLANCYGVSFYQTLKTVFGDFGLPVIHPFYANCLGIKTSFLDKDSLTYIKCYGFLQGGWLE